MGKSAAAKAEGVLDKVAPDPQSAAHHPHEAEAPPDNTAGAPNKDPPSLPPFLSLSLKHITICTVSRLALPRKALVQLPATKTARIAAPQQTARSQPTYLAIQGTA